MSQLTDRELLRKHAEGDEHAFEDLYRRHQDKLRAVATRIAGQDADDAFHNAMIKAWQTAGTFRGDCRVTTWLHRIVVNASVDITRRRPQCAELPERASSEESHRQLMRRMDIRKYWLQLPPDQRVAMLLVDELGYPVDEAARIVDIPEGTMKSRCARARTRMADKLGHLIGTQSR
ncbi:MAG TPA: sigma-70 family RNA polymerase sigma factor [Streptosporangiaceae bacterium]|jgi:RNA polymerase sigma-70 factor (ECF subfamily)